MLQVEVLEGAHLLLRRPLGKYDNVLVGPSADAEVRTDRVSRMIPMIRASPGGKGWELVYPAGLSGHVTAAGRTRSLAECAADASARADGDLAVFPLPEGAIGGIELGELRVRFREIPEADATTVLPPLADETDPTSIGIGAVAVAFVLLALLVFPRPGGVGRTGGAGGGTEIAAASPQPTGSRASGSATPRDGATAEPVPSEHRELPYATELPWETETPSIVEATPLPDGTALAMATGTPAPAATGTAAAIPGVTATPAAIANASPAPSAKPGATPIANASPTAKPGATPAAIANASPTAKPAATPSAIAKASPAPGSTAKPAATPTAVAKASPTAKPGATPSAIANASPTAKPGATPALLAKASPTPKPAASPRPDATPREHDPLALAVASPRATPKANASPVRTPPPSGFLGDAPVDGDDRFDERLDAVPTITPAKSAFTLDGGDSALTGTLGSGIPAAGGNVRDGGKGSVGDIAVGPAGTGDVKVASAGKVETPVEAKLQAAAPRVSGTIDADRVAAVVQEAAGAFRACYESALRRNTRISGKVILTWRIVEDGAAEEIRTGSSTLRDAEVERCLMTRVRRLRFPRPDGGAVSVEYPMVFYAAVDTN